MRSFDRGKGYLYPYDPDSPGKTPEFPLPLSPMTGFARNFILDRFRRLYM
jgi:hypothetical protein